MALEPVKMSTDITAQELKWWVRQWGALKNTSAFRYQDKHVKISYICMFMDKKILNAIEYRSSTGEKTLLDAILGYVRERLNPTQIKQLNVLKAHIEGGQRTCDILVNIC